MWCSVLIEAVVLRGVRYRHRVCCCYAHRQQHTRTRIAAAYAYAPRRYAVSGSEIADAPAIHTCAMRRLLRDVQYWPSVWCYAMSGTDLAYGATRERPIWYSPPRAYAYGTARCPVLT
eukprot:3507534-Rhodomonas_salina.2